MKDTDWKLLDTLYRFNSITKSADYLYTTQPSITRRLQTIEDELGIIIAGRTVKGLVFTPQGKLLAEKAREYQIWFEQTMAEVYAQGQALKGTIRISMPHSFLRLYFPELFQRYKKIYPNTTIEIYPGTSSEALQMVENNEVDIGFIRGDHTFEGERKKIITDYGYLVSQDTINFTDLPYLQHLSSIRDELTSQKIEEWWNQHFPNQLMRVQEIKEYDVCLNMISMGLGYGIVFSQESDIARSGLKMEKMYYTDGKPLEHPAWALWRYNQNNRLVNSFIATL